MASLAKVCCYSKKTNNKIISKVFRKIRAKFKMFFHLKKKRNQNKNTYPKENFNVDYCHLSNCRSKPALANDIKTTTNLRKSLLCSVLKRLLREWMQFATELLLFQLSKQQNPIELH